MSLTSSSQIQIAYKNLLGKSQTYKGKDLINEEDGIFFDVSSTSVWVENIPRNNPDLAIINQVTIEVIADLVTISNVENQSYRTIWPLTPPSGYSYGVGKLLGITGGQAMSGIISDSYGKSYSAIPYTSLTPSPSTQIAELDTRDWVYQYNSGIFYQDNPPPNPSLSPKKIRVYPYLGSRLSNTQADSLENIRITATGTNDYFSNVSIPSISTYSTNFLFLVDFVNTNTSGSVSLNVNGIGTTSILLNSVNGIVNLSPGEIIGASGSTPGPTYYLSYNGSYFQFFKSSPAQSLSGYTKLSPVIQENVGTIEKGTSFDNVTIQNVFNELLYGEESANILTFDLFDSVGNSVNSFEVGQTFSSGFYTFSWGITNSIGFQSNSANISRFQRSPLDNSGFTTLILTNGTNSVPYRWNMTQSFGVSSSGSQNNLPNFETYELSLKKNNGTISRKFKTVDWRFPIYYGSTTSVTISNSLILSLQKILSTQSSVSLTILGSGFKYLAIPEYIPGNLSWQGSSFGPIYSILSAGFPLNMAGASQGYTFSQSKSISSGTISSIPYSRMFITGSFGVGITYSIYRSINQIDGNIYVSTSETLNDDGTRISGTIRPIRSNDTYPVTDALLGIDGLRSVNSLSEMYNIPLERRRAGMVVAVPGPFNTIVYYKLIPGISYSLGSPSDWNLMFDFGTAGYGALPVKNNIGNEQIIVPINYQYLIYGNLNIGASGSLVNQGNTVIINGSINLTSDGTYSNVGGGTISFVNLKVEKKYSASFSATAGDPITINHNLDTSDIVWTVRDGNNYVYPNIVLVNSNSLLLTSFGTISNGRINIMG